MTDTKPPYVEHLGKSRQYWRDIILGVNDGLVSIFLLVAAVVGGGFSTPNVLLTAIAGAIAGAVSMAVGEYIATKSQEEVFQREMDLEREHMKYHREVELDELREWFGDLGFEGDLLDEVVSTIDGDDQSLMRVMMAFEFGVVEHTRRSPITAMAASGGLFFAGSLPSIVPFTLGLEPTIGLLWAAILASVSLFVVGAGKTYATRRHPIKSGLENLALATAGAALSYGVGVGYERAFGN